MDTAVADELRFEGSVLIVEDEESAFRYMTRIFRRWNVVGCLTLRAARDALPRIRALRLALLDICLPDTVDPKHDEDGTHNVFAFVKEIAAAAPRARIVIVTALTFPWLANEAQKVGAEFLYKSHYGENLDRIVERLEGGEVGGSEVRVRWARRCSATYRLTPKETRVLELAVMGLTVRGIADQLSIAENTAKTHVRNILAKTGEERLRDLVILAREDES